MGRVTARGRGALRFPLGARVGAQVAIHQGRRVYAFVRPGDVAAPRFAESLGVHWAGASDEKPPEPLDAAILYAPVGALVPAALDVVRPGGSVVCAGIHTSDIQAFSVPAVVAGALGAIGRESHASGRRGVLRDGEPDPARDHGRRV